MKIYSFYSPSHEILKHEFFLPSLYGQNEFEPVVIPIEQVGSVEKHAFGSREFIDTMYFKIDIVIKAIQANWGDTFVYSDIDVQFFKPMKQSLLALLQDKDILFQKNSVVNDACAGFFVCRANQRVLQLWFSIKKWMHDKQTCDQNALNVLLAKGTGKTNLLQKLFRGSPLKWGFLSDDFFCTGVQVSQIWEPGMPVSIPPGIIMHHANWTIGIDNKRSLLGYVREQVREQKNSVILNR